MASNSAALMGLPMWSFMPASRQASRCWDSTLALSATMGVPRLGPAPWRIARVHILPNIVPAILVQATLTIAAAIIAEASLSFLGLGQQPPEPSWGAMLNTAKNFMDEAPWMAIWPGLSIFLAVLAFNLFGDGLRDALDPRQRT